MSHGPPKAADLPEPSVVLNEGWHCTHSYYEFDRLLLEQYAPEQIAEGRGELESVLSSEVEGSPQRLQTSIVSGHKADFGLLVMDPDPLVVDRVHQNILATEMGPALRATYSFVSVTEVSEYVPSIEQYAQRLVAEGEEEGSPGYAAKVAAYERRAPMMRKQRLTPDFPDYPAMCFYPMNKKRKVGENWFMMSFKDRNQLMAEHARSGMEFAGRVSQLITVGVGYEDWEWGVTLWARNPEYLKDIVYRMRFDEASARYAEFGPFYTSYIATPAEVFEHCRIG